MRLEEKKSSIHLYSRKNKEELVELILKHRDKELIEDKNNDEGIAEEERFALEKAKAEEERITLENDKAEEERITLENDKAEEERITLENAKAVEEKLALEKAKSEVEKNVIVDKNSNLKRKLSESFPNKKISVTDNKNGSQTILVY